MREEVSKSAVKHAQLLQGAFLRHPSVKSSCKVLPGQEIYSAGSGDQSVDRELAVSVLNLVPMGVILTDKRCRTLLVNRAAEKILYQHDGLKLERDVLVAASSREARAMRKLVNDAIYSASSDHIKPCSAMTVSRPSFRRPYEIVVVGLSVTGLLRRSPAMVAGIFIGQQEVEVSTVEPVIAGLYGLTPAESRLAAMLMWGKSLNEVSGELQITRETARTHLRNIFAKTQTNRQSELVRLLVAGPGNVYLRN
ncbi:MAG TPA: helix-turn-helix transcriptional regulator [Terriglobia bacterium]|nr:helix-turn-helix transcriptional regulator [Terriglobia bacterium]